MQPSSALRRCKRCATCCRKGGPALHYQDKQLVIKGRLPLENLFTIRPREPVMDNVAGRPAAAPGDIIKIKSKPASSACIFLETDSNRCTIYHKRPLECRVLECWQPEKLTAIYSHQRLDRKELLLPDRKWLWELICEHENRCGYLQVTRLARNWLAHQDPESAACLLEIMRYDTVMRQLCSDQGKIAPAITDFLFGLPLAATIGRLGVGLARNNEGQYYLTKSVSI